MEFLIYLDLTERDYHDFVIYLNRDERSILPPSVRSALAVSSSLLFIGYNVQDIDFQTIFQGALSFIGTLRMGFKIATQAPPQVRSSEEETKIIQYLEAHARDEFGVKLRTPITNTCINEIPMILNDNEISSEMSQVAYKA